MHQTLVHNIHLYFIFTSDCTKGWVCAMHKMTVTVDGKITSNLCKSMKDEFNTMSLINAINAERRGVGQPSISASDDMCATALIKGLVQKVSTSRNHHQHYFIQSTYWPLTNLMKSNLHSTRFRSQRRNLHVGSNLTYMIGHLVV